jgi:hypothetical protein
MENSNEDGHWSELHPVAAVNYDIHINSGIYRA